MDPILFYGVPEGCSFGSIVALEWTGRPYRLCRIQMPEIVSSDEYKRTNGVGETPSLMTETGGVISESMAILNHIGARAIDEGLAFAQGSAGFDRLNQVLAFLNTSFFNAFSPLWHVVEHGLEGAEKDALVGYGSAKVEKAHADLEKMLDGCEWLLGDRRTLADAYFFGIARWADFHEVIDRRGYPSVQRLFETVRDDPRCASPMPSSTRSPRGAPAGSPGRSASRRRCRSCDSQPDDEGADSSLEVPAIPPDAAAGAASLGAKAERSTVRNRRPDREVHVTNACQEDLGN